MSEKGQEEEKSGDYSDEEVEGKKSKKKRNAKLTRFAKSEAQDSSVSMGLVGSNACNTPTPFENKKPGKQARDERRAKRNKANMEDTNIAPGGEAGSFEDNYATNKGAASGKKLMVGDDECALEDMSYSKADLNDI